MKRGELAKRTGCNIETVRYYEKAGLLPDPPRTDKGYRVYSDTHEQTLRFIMRSRELGFSVEEVRGLLSLVDGGTYTCSEIRDKTLQHLTSVRKRIADLQRLEQTLSDTVANCEGGNTPRCAVIDALVKDG
ncbi:helix-turn-helix domain-containing protein [Magnetovibrio sp. PR-2]|uniref:MerR family transcriptional regulator n=1 Tax=Magnetovibrio sp. PR-2 TaxID=3120356 RepID=UPI002FCE6188